MIVRPGIALSALIQDRDGADRIGGSELFSLLSKTQRREILSYLIEDTDGSTAVEDVGAYLAECSDRATEMITLALLHIHLPKSAYANAIRYDRAAGTVRCRLRNKSKTGSLGWSETTLQGPYDLIAEVARWSVDELGLNIFEWSFMVPQKLYGRLLNIGRRNCHEK